MPVNIITKGEQRDGIVVVLEITSVSDPRKLMLHHSTEGHSRGDWNAW